MLTCQIITNLHITVLVIRHKIWLQGGNDLSKIEIELDLNCIDEPLGLA